MSRSFLCSSVVLSALVIGCDPSERTVRRDLESSLQRLAEARVSVLIESAVEPAKERLAELRRVNRGKQTLIVVSNSDVSIEFGESLAHLLGETRDSRAYRWSMVYVRLGDPASAMRAAARGLLADCMEAGIMPTAPLPPLAFPSPNAMNSPSHHGWTGSAVVAAMVLVGSWMGFRRRTMNNGGAP